MNMLLEFNAYVSWFFPPAVWPLLQIVLGGGVMIGTFAKRTSVDRYRTSNITCRRDAIITRIGQIGLAIMGTAGFALMFDGLVSQNVPPRSTILVIMAGYSMVQISIIYQAVTDFVYRR